MRTGIALLTLVGSLPAQQSTLVQPLFAQFEPGLDCEQPQMAVGPDGAQALVFVAGGNSVRIAIRPPGKEWQEPLPVAALPQLAFGNHRGPRVAWSGTALLVACIESHFDASTRTSLGSGNLTVRRSTDLGAHWSAPVTVNGEDGSAREGLHALAANGPDVALVWLDPRGEPKAGRLWCALSQDGGVTFGKDFLAHGGKEAICPCCHPSLCIGSKGVTALWRDAIDGNRDLYTGVITAQGQAIAAPQAAGTGRWHLNACPMDGGGLALDGAGSPVSVWRQQDTIYWASAGREHRLGTGRNPSLAIAGHVALAVWESAGRLAGARLDPDHADAKDPRRIDLLELGAGAFPCVAATLAGRFTVAAESAAGGRKRIAAVDL